MLCKIIGLMLCFWVFINESKSKHEKDSSNGRHSRQHDHKESHDGNGNHEKEVNEADFNISTTFWGSTFVTANNIPLEKLGTYGYINYNYKIPMNSKAQYPIGSNTKLFTAVAIYQLQEQGKLNVNDNINLYLNQNDFIKFGYTNISYYCPILYEDMLNNNTNNCQNITFIHLLSMNSGLIETLNCDYEDNSPYIQYCWNSCDISTRYQGSINYYINKFISLPLTNIPGTNYHYNNNNFILATYFIEKLSGLTYGEYLNQYILGPLNLTNTYYDAWDSNFEIHHNRIDEHYIYKNISNTNEILSIGSCLPYLSSGVANGAGGMISSIQDMNKWYYYLFNPNLSIPLIFHHIETLQSLLYPYTYVGAASFIMNNSSRYFAQGVEVIYLNNDDNKLWPEYILYEGGTVCSITFIIMKYNDNNYLTVSSFTNAPNLYVPNNDFNYVKNNASLSLCDIINQGYILFEDEAYLVALELLEQYS